MKNWRDTIVRPDANIRDALRALDKGAQKIALVCDEGDQLVAVISDGDIRRGLLSELHMHDSVAAVANTTPRVAKQGLTLKEIRSILISEKINVLPIVDSENRVITLHTLESITSKPKLENPVFIMAGGFGTRLRPLTDHYPKPMLPIGDKPVLQHIIERMRGQGFKNFYISTHYLPQRITDYFGDGSGFGVNVEYVHEEIPLGTGGALGLLPEGLSQGPIIVINGDVVTDLEFADLLECHRARPVDATMCLREQETSLVYGVVETDDGIVTSMVEKPTYRHLINTGIYVLSLDCVKSVIKNQRIDLPSLLQKRMNDGFVISAYTFYGKWIDIGKIKDYKRAQDELGY